MFISDSLSPYLVAWVATDRSIQRVGRQAQKAHTSANSRSILDRGRQLLIKVCHFKCAKKLSPFRACMVYNSLLYINCCACCIFYSNALYKVVIAVFYWNMCYTKFHILFVYILCFSEVYDELEQVYTNREAIRKGISQSIKVLAEQAVTEVTHNVL